jgi:hypothetical protein
MYIHAYCLVLQSTQWLLYQLFRTTQSSLIDLVGDGISLLEVSIVVAATMTPQFW